MVNLYSKKLIEDHISVLSKGLKFCGTPDYPEPDQCRTDLDSLHRRLREIGHYNSPVKDLPFLASQMYLTPKINDFTQDANL